MHLIFKIQNDSTKFNIGKLCEERSSRNKIQEPWIEKCTTTYQALRWFFLGASTLSVSQEPNEEWYYGHRDNIKEKVTKIDILNLRWSHIPEPLELHLLKSEKV